MEALIRFAADVTLLLILIVAGAASLWAIRGRFWSAMPVVVMAALTSLFVGKLMSLVYQPEIARPFLKLGVAPGAAYIDNPGFPSDHALLGTVAVVACYALTRNKPLGLVLIGLLVVMCIARVAALVHTPGDVIGGVAAGLAGAVWYRKLTK